MTTNKTPIRTNLTVFTLPNKRDRLCKKLIRLTKRLPAAKKQADRLTIKGGLQQREVVKVEKSAPLSEHSEGANVMNGQGGGNVAGNGETAGGGGTVGNAAFESLLHPSLLPGIIWPPLSLTRILLS